MELVIVWGTGGTENSVAYLGEHQIYNFSSQFNSHQSFGQWLKVLANLTNLFSRDLGKTPMTGIAIEITLCFTIRKLFFFIFHRKSSVKESLGTSTRKMYVKFGRFLSSRAGMAKLVEHSTIAR